MLDLGRKPFHCFFYIEISKNRKDYSFRWLSTAPSQRIIALWVHPYTINTLATRDYFPGFKIRFTNVLALQDGKESCPLPYLDMES